MKIFDGLDEYKKNAEYWKFTIDLERRGEGIVKILQKYGESTPGKECLQEAKAFLVEVENWKGMSMRNQVGLAKRNSEPFIWRAFQQAMNSETDLGAIRSLMSLIGFGSSPHPETGLRRAKRTTAVLRFLKPYDWGAVDWRTIAILRFLEKHSFDVGRGLAEATMDNPKDLQKDLDHINEDWACEINQKYKEMRTLELPRAADVEMALFGLSMVAWPLPV